MSIEIYEKNAVNFDILFNIISIKEIVDIIMDYKIHSEIELHEWNCMDDIINNHTYIKDGFKYNKIHNFSRYLGNENKRFTLLPNLIELCIKICKDAYNSYYNYDFNFIHINVVIDNGIMTIGRRYDFELYYRIEDPEKGEYAHDKKLLSKGFNREKVGHSLIKYTKINRDMENMDDYIFSTLEVIKRTYYYCGKQIPSITILID